MNDYINDKEDPEREFEIIEKICNGRYGVIYKIKHKKTGKILIAKIMNIKKGIDYYKKEITFLTKCTSPYIVSYYGSYSKKYSIWLIFEYCDRGNLLDIINMLKDSLTEEQIASLVYMILQGLTYLNENKKMHRFLKTSNILLTHEGICKISDFGFNPHIMHSLYKNKSHNENSLYMSPEIIMQNKYNYKCDIWSLGIICIEIAERELPFVNLKPYQILRSIITQEHSGLKYKEKWTKEFNDFVSKCLSFDPNQRPSAKELLNHPFIIKNNKGNKIISELINKGLNNIKINEEKRGVLEEKEYGEYNIKSEVSTEIINKNYNEKNDNVIERNKIRDEKDKGSFNEIDDIINDDSINNLTRKEIEEELVKIEEEMSKEIQRVKDEYNTKINKYKKSLEFLEENHYFKDIDLEENSQIYK